MDQKKLLFKGDGFLGTTDGGEVYRVFSVPGYMSDYKLLKDLLKEIHTNPAHTQRSLAQKLNISLGKINYILSGLIEKGMIKAKRFQLEPGKIRWHYILTSEGMRDKLHITKEYLKNRLVEFDMIQHEIQELKLELAESDCVDQR